MSQLRVGVCCLDHRVPGEAQSVGGDPRRHPRFQVDRLPQQLAGWFRIGLGIQQPALIEADDDGETEVVAVLVQGAQHRALLGEAGTVQVIDDQDFDLPQQQFLALPPPCAAAQRAIALSGTPPVAKRHHQRGEDSPQSGYRDQRGY